MTKRNGDRRLELYHQGYTDVDIAREVRITVSSVWKWRTDRGLPSLHGKSMRELAIKELEKLGMTQQDFIGYLKRKSKFLSKI